MLKTNTGQMLQSVDGKLKLASVEDFYKHLEDNDYEVDVELWMLNEKKNRNNWIYENTAAHLKRFAGKPILISYKNGQLGAGHEMDETTDENGNPTQSFMSASAERIVGVLGQADSIRIETDEDGVEWVVGKGKIFGFYAPELAKRLLGETGSLKDEMRISIETLIYKMRTEGGVEIYSDWRVLGVTILGDNVTEAVAGANIRALAALTEEKIEEITLRVASAYVQSKNQHKTATKTVKRSKKMKLSDIRNHFANCTVLGVNGDVVALLDENGSACVATITEDGENAVCGDVVKANASITFENGDNTVEVPFDAYSEAVKTMSARITELEQSYNSAKEEAENAVKIIEEMKNAEHARRLEAVKNAIKDKLNSIRKFHADEVSAELCDDMLTDNALEEYCTLEKDGKWCGIEAACKEVSSRVMDCLMANEVVKANNARKTYVWDETDPKPAVDETVAMFDRLNKAL